MSHQPKRAFTLDHCPVLLYIIGPVLCLYSWRILEQKKAAGTPITKIFNIWPLLFIIGGALIFRMVFFEVIMTASNRIVSGIFRTKLKTCREPKTSSSTTLIKLPLKRTITGFFQNHLAAATGHMKDFASLDREQKMTTERY